MVVIPGLLGMKRLFFQKLFHGLYSHPRLEAQAYTGHTNGHIQINADTHRHTESDTNTHTHTVTRRPKYTQFYFIFIVVV